MQQYPARFPLRPTVYVGRPLHAALWEHVEQAT